MHVSRRQLGHPGKAALIDDEVVLATELSPVRGMGAGVFSAQGGRHAVRVDAGA